MRKKFFLSGLFLVLVATAVSSVLSGDAEEQYDYLPIIVKAATPTVTPTPTQTPTPTPTSTPPPSSTGDIRITDIFYDGVAGSQEPDEYVVIQNFDSVAIQLQSWTLRDSNGANPKTFTFPNFLIQPGQVCRIYTNQIHPSTCGFSFNNGTAIWNNSGDCGTLRNSVGQIINEYCY